MSMAIDFIKDAEGLRLKSYQDGAGVWTIGYGHTGTDVTSGNVISDERAEELLGQDMGWALELVESTVTAPLSEGQHAAVVSLIFNIGAGAWRSSTALRRLNALNYEGAADAMTWWNKITVGGAKVISPGLVTRRERERVMFLGVSSNPIPTETVASRGQVVGGEAKPLKKSKTQWLAGGGILTSVMVAWSNIRDSSPELVEWALPYLPYVFALIFVGVLVNRWAESRKGVH